LMTNMDNNIKELHKDIYVICIFLGINIGLSIFILLGLIFGFK